MQRQPKENGLFTFVDGDNVAYELRISKDDLAKLLTTRDSLHRSTSAGALLDTIRKQDGDSSLYRSLLDAIARHIVASMAGNADA